MSLFSNLVKRSRPVPALLRSLCNSASPSSSHTISQPIIEAGKRNIDQSPWKVNFLVKLVRNKWVPDALAQLKFSPKHKARDVAKILNRAVSLASMRHDAIPEELCVHEIAVTKGNVKKQLTIMGRGRAGFGYKRWCHVNLKVKVINFDEMILTAKTKNQKETWIKRKELVRSIKETGRPQYIIDGKKKDKAMAE